MRSLAEGEGMAAVTDGKVRRSCLTRANSENGDGEDDGRKQEKEAERSCEDTGPPHHSVRYQRGKESAWGDEEYGPTQTSPFYERDQERNESYNQAYSSQKSKRNKPHLSSLILPPPPPLPREAPNPLVLLPILSRHQRTCLTEVEQQGDSWSDCDGALAYWRGSLLQRRDDGKKSGGGGREREEEGTIKRTAFLETKCISHC